MRAIKEETKAAVNSIQSEMEETVKNLTENGLTSVYQRTQGLREELNKTHRGS